MTRPHPSIHPLAPALDAAWAGLDRLCGAWLQDQSNHEVLHELRVAWRRCRAILDLLRRDEALETSANAVKTAAKPLSQLSSPLRDLDVLSAALGSWCEQEPALAPLQQLIGARREQSAAPLLAQFLGAERCGLERAMSALRRALGKAAMPAEGWQQRQLKRCERRVFRALKRCATKPDAETWHRLRIRCKQWRYTLELFAAKPTDQKTLRRLRGLQQCLGQAQDALTFERLLTELAQATLPAKSLLAIGRQQAWLEQQHIAALKKAQRKLKRLLL